MLVPYRHWVPGSKLSGVTRGWDAVLARYHRNYPDRAAMGQLEFSGLEITPLCDNAALILGNWHLDRGTPVGASSLGNPPIASLARA